MGYGPPCVPRLWVMDVLRCAVVRSCRCGRQGRVGGGMGNGRRVLGWTVEGKSTSLRWNARRTRTFGQGKRMNEAGRLRPHRSVPRGGLARRTPRRTTRGESTGRCTSSSRTASRSACIGTRSGGAVGKFEGRVHNGLSTGAARGAQGWANGWGRGDPGEPQLQPGSCRSLRSLI